jgi:uncharacterized protein (DUF1697 family)
MQKQVALIRGINVGTAKRVAMADLRVLIEELGYKDVRTLLNSGNAVFSVPPKVKGDAAAQIQAGITKKCGVSAKVLTVTAENLNIVVAENPLAAVATDPARYLIAFVAAPADLAKLAGLAAQAALPDAVAIGSHAAYLWCAGGVNDNKLFASAHRLLGDRLTTRNWTTVLKLRAMLAD